MKTMYLIKDLVGGYEQGVKTHPLISWCEGKGKNTFKTMCPFRDERQIGFSILSSSYKMQFLAAKADARRGHMTCEWHAAIRTKWMLEGRNKVQ